MGFESALAIIKRNKARKDRGEWNSIPFPFPNLNKYVPGIMQGTYYCTSASSGIGKTQVAKNMFVTSPYEWLTENKTNIKLKIFYFALEESVTEFIMTMISAKLKKLYNKTVPISVLMSRDMETTLDDETIKQVEELSDYFKDFEKCIEIIDTLSDIDKMYAHVEKYMNYRGKVLFRNLETGDITDIKTPGYIPYKYEAKDPDEYVMVVVDHVSLVTGTDNSLHSNMSSWSNVLARRRLTKFYNCVVVDIQQQSSDVEKMQYSRDGSAVEDKVKPSLSGYGDNKLTQRNHLVVFGLFAPDRYGIQTYGGIPVQGMNDHIRFLIVLKNRYGPSNVEIPLYFNGATNEFYELPEPSVFRSNRALIDAVRNGTFVGEVAENH